MADLSRRDLLTMASAGALMLSRVNRAVSSSVDLVSMPVGLELYPLNEELAKDPEGTLRKVAEIGFRRVELPSLYGAKPEQIKQMLVKAGLDCISAGTLSNPLAPGMRSLETHAEEIFAEFRELGVTYIVNLLPPLPASKRAGPVESAYDTLTVADWHEAAAFLNEMGRKARAHGLRLAHHNHHYEFSPLERTTGFEILIRATDPAFVEFELDCAFVAAMGFDPAAMLRRHAARIALLHLKDIEARKVAGKPLQMVALGQGIINWPPVFRAMRRSNIKQYYIELEPPFKKPVFDSLTDSYRYLVTGLKKV
ncbi:MAG TPA: sugar phosphate isomerase/epimerase [Steroidobacteraceae bacterium]|nr:sugar phosphate isomerase/epimerase [Steroidobacteraceae bacterium]